MSGDYTRFTHDPRKRYAGVLMQQGRVQLDADWNEEVELIMRRWRLQAADTFGPAAVPKATTPAGFEVTGAALNLGVGRIYVDGLLAEILPGEACSYANQPFYPNPPPLAGLAGPNGIVYLDVWQREVTYIQDGAILEKALGGPDTATRVQTVWQVKVHGMGNNPAACGMDLSTQFPPSAARMSSRTVAPPPADDPCIIGPSGGYRGLENRLYRVEVHTPGNLAAARFKWSRENASVVSEVRQIRASGGQTILRVGRIGRDAVLRFAAGDWVEVLDDVRELRGEPGEMARIAAPPDEANLTITLDRAFPPNAFGATDQEVQDRHTRLRRWDQKNNIAMVGAVQTGLVNVSNAWLPLEEGVQVRFSLQPAAGQFRVGDYWVFAARTADGSVEALTDAPPRGIQHRYCQLATVRGLGPGGAPAPVADCRPLWPRVTETCCVMTVGDGGNCSEGQYPTIAAAIAAIDPASPCPVQICLLAGTHRITQPIVLNHDGITVSGCGGHSRITAEGTAFIVPAGTEEVTLEHFALTTSARVPAVIWGGGIGRVTRLEMDAAGPGIVTTRAVNFIVSDSLLAGPQPLSLQGQELIVSGNIIRDGGVEVRIGTNDVIVRDNFIGGGPGNGITLGGVRGGEPSAVMREITLERNHIRATGESGIGSAEAARAACIDFAAMPPGPGPNPRTEENVDFVVRDHQVNDEPRSRIDSGHGITGLNCGFSTEVRLPVSAPRVHVTLAHFSEPAEIEAFNGDGTSAGLVSMGRPRGLPERLSLAGPDIRRVEIRAPENNTLLMEFCFDAGPTEVRDAVVMGLRIRDNLISDCVSPNRAARADGLPYGGIVLGSVANALIHGNRVERNGVRTQAPVCGIYARRALGLDITDNRVVDNGRPPGGIQGRAGQGGIVVPQVSAMAAGRPSSGEAHFAIRVDGNLVVTSGTLALYLRGAGPQIVTNNRLVSLGNGGLSPNELGNLGQVENAIVRNPERFVGSVVILNGGVERALGGLSAVHGYRMGAVAPVLSPTHFAGATGEFGGQVQFSDNQVVLDMDPRAPAALPVGVAVLTLGDLVMNGNQTESRLGPGQIQFYGTFALAATARAVANGYFEAPGQCETSLALRGTAMSTGADNQATHCILIYGPPAPPVRTVNRDNLSLYCRRTGNVPLMGILPFP